MTNMYEKRRHALRSHIQNQSLTAALITDPANVFYFTGFNSDPHERFLGLYIEATDGKTILFTPALDKDAAAESSDIETIVSISDEQLPFDVISPQLVSFQEKWVSKRKRSVISVTTNS